MPRSSITRLEFALLTGLAVTTVLAWGHAAALRWEQTALQEALRELQAVEREHGLAIQQLGQFRTQVKELQRQTSVLEEILYHRACTYLFVSGNMSAIEKNEVSLSRAGHSPVGKSPAAVHMPVCGSSGFTASDFENAWQAFRAQRLQGLGEALMRAEQEYGINALVLAAIVAHESCWGRSAIARDKNNLAGLGALDGSPYASAMTFVTKEESVYFLAELLAREYILPEGQHYHGPNLAGIGIRYASDPAWAWKVAAMMQLLARAMVSNPETLLEHAFH